MPRSRLSSATSATTRSRRRSHSCCSISSRTRSGWSAGSAFQTLRNSSPTPAPTETFLADVDAGFYCACYLRAWALETHLRGHLRERFGPAWFQSRAAGDVLRGLWRAGQRLAPEELLADLTGAQLDFSVMLADLGLAQA